MIMISSADFAFFSLKERLQLLNGNCPCNLTKPGLRAWLLYHVGTAKDGSALSDAYKHEPMHRWAGNEGNKDYKYLKSKAFGLFNYGYVQTIEVVLPKMETWST